MSPYTKTADEVDAEVMVLLQDWSSDEELSRGLDENTQHLGYTPTQPTSLKLEELLKKWFDLSLSDIYGTNLFPFVKRGKVSSRIPEQDLMSAAKEFALPQIEIVNPRLVICLGLATFDALRRVHGLARAGNMDASINSPFTVGNSRVWCQAHTGAFGRMNRNKKGVDRISQDWLRMKADWVSRTLPSTATS